MARRPRALILGLPHCRSLYTTGAIGPDTIKMRVLTVQALRLLARKASCHSGISDAKTLSSILTHLSCALMNVVALQVVIRYNPQPAGCLPSTSGRRTVRRIVVRACPGQYLPPLQAGIPLPSVWGKRGCRRTASVNIKSSSSKMFKFGRFECRVLFFSSSSIVYLLALM